MSFAVSFAVLASSMAFAEQAADAPAMPQPTENPFRIGKTAFRDINFVPPRWKLVDKVVGDLDGDGTTDSVLIVQQNDPKNLMDNKDGFGMDYYDANPRVVIVALQKNAGEYHLADFSTDIIPDHSQPTISDPYEDMRIDKGSLHLNVVFFANAGSWWMSSHRFQFRWDGKAMALIGFETSSVHRASGDIQQASVNYLSRRRKDSKGKISDSQENWQWSDVPKGTAHTLNSIGDAFDFEG
ncbi:MAG: hypothetical protein ABJP34_06065 [Erythrobacter sp.]